MRPVRFETTVLKYNRINICQYSVHEINNKLHILSGFFSSLSGAKRTFDKFRRFKRQFIAFVHRYIRLYFFF